MSGWTDFRDKLEDVAPTLLGGAAGIFGGPAAAVAVSKITGLLLGKQGTEKEALAALAAATPEQLLQLKQLDIDYKKSLLEYGFKEDELIVKDRDSARTRDATFVTAGRTNVRADFLAYGAVVMLGIFSILVFFKQVPDAGPTRDLLFTLAGGLISLVKDVYSFEFGSSKSGAIKDATIAKLSE